MNDPKRPVSLEDLLRLKRAERPPAEFWNEFDRQLRAKQLAALVEKRPWWHGLRESFLRVGRYHVAFGTAAVVAFVFISNRERLFPVASSAQAPSVAPTVALPESQVRVQVANPTAAAVQPVGASVVHESAAGAPVSGVAKAVRMEVPVASASSFVSTAAFTPDGERERTEGSDTLSPLEVITGSSIEPTPAKPSARFIAANFAAAQAAQEVVAVPLLGNTQGFEARGLPARAGAAIDPLQNMAPPGEPRRSARFLAAMVSINNDDLAARNTERMANRISQEELYDQVRRFGTRHGGFNMKF